MKEKNILYVFGGEKSSGAEFVIETLIRNNYFAQSYLIMSPGSFYERLSKEQLPYTLIGRNELRKLYIVNSGLFARLKKGFLFIRNMLKICGYTYRYVNKKNIKILHVNTIAPAVYLLPLVMWYKIWKKNIKCIWSDHDIVYPLPALERLLPLIVKYYDKTLVVSNAVKRKYANNPNVVVLYNGLDKDKINLNRTWGVEFRSQYGIDRRAVVFGIMGQIVERKGVVELISAFKEFVEEITDATLIIAGTPTEESSTYYREFLTQISNFDKIKYIGYCSNISLFYNGVDIVINNSGAEEGEEPLGTTLLEGLAYARLVMATNVGGSQEIIQNGYNGILYENNHTELVSALREAYGIQKSGTDVNTYRRNAQTVFMEKFEINDMVKNYNKIIDGLKTD